ncbi:MAG: TetR/AcrR family transcriptional regulator [Kiritimatiellae bacterium]|nr:TetR/AcrR family transcriptional regulator [Kiritimatiellia bacterium]
MARKTKAETEKTRIRILDAARDLFISNGYERTTFEDIAKRINLSKGAVFWHFKSKSDLLLTLLREAMEQYDAELGQSQRLVGSPEALVEYCVARARHMTSRLKRRKFFVMVNRLNWASPQMAIVKNRFMQVESGMHAVIARNMADFKDRGMIRPDVNVDEMTVLLSTMWLGLLRARLCGGVVFDCLETLKVGLDLILRGVLLDPQGSKKGNG